jgi:hypothetical protein
MPRSKKQKANLNCSVQPMFASGRSVAPGTYVSLEDGHFVRVTYNSALPGGNVAPLFYVRLSESPEYLVPVSLLPEAA